MMAGMKMKMMVMMVVASVLGIFGIYLETQCLLLVKQTFAKALLLFPLVIYCPMPEFLDGALGSAASNLIFSPEEAAMYSKQFLQV